MSKIQNIAFLGLGAMGQRMAARLLGGGYQVSVWNRSPAATELLVSKGAIAAATPREAATGADLVISMVFDDQASRRVWLDPVDGAALGLGPDVLAVESSTLTPGWIAQLAQALPVPLMDAPVAGSRGQAESGQLIFMVGGASELIERCRPVLLAMGAAVHALGPSGSGSWLKLAVNSLFSVQVVAMAELISLLRAVHLDLKVAVDALRAMPVTSAAAGGAAALMLAGNYEPQAPVDLISKDLAYTLGSSTTGLPLIEAAALRFQAAQRAGLGAENLVAVSKLYA